MSRSRSCRALALALCAQPAFWLGATAQAQVFRAPVGDEPAGRQAGGPAPAVPIAAVDPDAARAERAAAPQAPAPAVDEPLDPDRYVCGPGDVLELNFWGVQTFKLRATVDLEGRAYVARVGYLQLGGKTLSEARRELRASVGRYFPGLGFDAALAEPRTFVVQVVDAVGRPGATPARAVDRVSAVIARAGGFAPRASRRRVEIRRRDGTNLVVDLLRYEQTGDVGQNPWLLDGDVVRVPFEALAATVDGAVNRPGRYELIGTRDVAELVELAGGLSPAATPALPIAVVRRGADDRLEQTLHAFEAGGAVPAVPLPAEATVHVPGLGELQRSVTLVGATAGVASPEDPAAIRRLPFAQGDSVRTLVERAGGVGPLADLEGAYLVRGGAVVPVDLHALLVLRDLAADRGVELGDALVVPFKRRNVTVEGAVFRPGAYQFNPSYGVEQYLGLAGGPNRFALELPEVYVVTAGGVRRPYAPDLRPEPGSAVVVPERSFSRSEIVQIVLSATGILLSGVAVVLAARK